jgi:hypothetical protein
MLLALGEAYFRFVYAETNSICTLACQNWINRYWQTNSLGFRDREWTPADWAGKKTVLVIGDSFAAGFGLTNTADRFSNVLAGQLGDGYAVMNLGVRGSATPKELTTLQNYPLEHPGVVILQYYLNDIDDAALSIGLDPGIDVYKDVPSWVNESYMANFFYWRLALRYRTDLRDSQQYFDWEYQMYDNSTVWQIHQQQLNAFMDEVQPRGARLIVVIFPNMADPVSSIAYVDRVAQAFQARGYNDILKLFDAAAAWSPQDRMVSTLDSHASAAFNHYVGQQLYKLFVAGR